MAKAPLPMIRRKTRKLTKPWAIVKDRDMTKAPLNDLENTEKTNGLKLGLRIRLWLRHPSLILRKLRTPKARAKANNRAMVMAIAPLSVILRKLRKHKTKG